MVVPGRLCRQLCIRHDLVAGVGYPLDLVGAHHLHPDRRVLHTARWYAHSHHEQRGRSKRHH